MKSTFNIAVTAGNGIGGTEKAAVLYAGEMVRRGHRVLTLTPAGPRDGLIRQCGIRQVEPPSSPREMAELLQHEQIDVIHQHVPGYLMPNPNYEALALMGDKRPRLIETNVFGHLTDHAGDPWVDFRAFVSQASAVQAFQRSGRRLIAEELQDKTVIYYPLPPLDSASRTRMHRETIRKEFGIQPHELLILRLGRPGAKWMRSEVMAFRSARRNNPNLRMLLMEPNGDIWREVATGLWGEGIMLHKAMTDFERLAAVYSAGDLMLHMANWGESFGYTIAEAMQHGVPLVVGTTPWGDNAQVELIEHGESGFVCNSCEGAADALVKLADDAALRAKMGEAGAARIDLMSNLVREGDLLEQILHHVVGGEPLTKVVDRNRALLDFASKFADRERHVWELENPGLRWPHFKGTCYSTYRVLKARAGQIKKALKSRRK